jgi:hypothetical protein
MLIQRHYATVETIQFDAAEPDNTLGTDGATDSAVATYGYNRYSESGYRAWLNSDKKAGEWFGSTFERNGKIITRREADVAPKELSTVNGFMAGLPDDFLSILKPVQITTACNTVTDGGVIDTTYDTFFLPSLENICVEPEADAGTEGGNYDYWLERVGTTARKKESSFPRGITYDIKNHTTARNVILRSAKRGYSHNMRYVSYTGSVGFAGSDGYSFANKDNASTPICAIC